MRAPVARSALPGKRRAGAAYNRAMVQTLQQMFAPAVMERLTLLANHVIGAEQAATQRLAPHAGKVLQFEALNWPPLLPSLPPLAWRITPAGLLEWCGLERTATPQLTVRVHAENPAALAARFAAGEAPRVEIDGDAQLATEVDWMMQNLRWDVAGDLERVFPPALANAIARMGHGMAAALRAALRGVDGLRDRWRK